MLEEVVEASVMEEEDKQASVVQAVVEELVGEVVENSVFSGVMAREEES